MIQIRIRHTGFYIINWSLYCIIYFYFLYRKRPLRTVNQIVDALEELDTEEEEEVDDSDLDRDYVDAGGDNESSSDDEPVASSSKSPAKRVRLHARASNAANGREVFQARSPQREVLIFMDPPVEKADGDTDVDSGKFFIYYVYFYFYGSSHQFSRKQTFFLIKIMIFRRQF